MGNSRTAAGRETGVESCDQLTELRAVTVFLADSGRTRKATRRNGSIEKPMKPAEMRPPKANFVSVALLAIAALAAVLPAWAQSADTILLNGKILTVDANFSTREALAVRDGKIMAVGSNAEIRKLAEPKTRVIDLRGRTVIPGGAGGGGGGCRSHPRDPRWATFTCRNELGVRPPSPVANRIHELRWPEAGSWLVVAGE